MKRSLSLVLILVLLLSLFGCRTADPICELVALPDEPVEKTQETAQSDGPSAQEVFAEELKTEEPFKKEEPLEPTEIPEQTAEIPEQTADEPYPTIKRPENPDRNFIFLEAHPEKQTADEFFVSVTKRGKETVTVYDPAKIDYNYTRWDRYIYPTKTTSVSDLDKYHSVLKDGLLVAGTLEGNREGHYRPIEEFPFDEIYTLSQLRIEHVFAGDAEVGDVIEVSEEYFFVVEEGLQPYYYIHDFTSGYAKPQGNGELKLFFLQKSPRNDGTYEHALSPYQLNEDYLEYTEEHLEAYLDELCLDPGEEKKYRGEESTIFYSDGTAEVLCFCFISQNERPREEVLAELLTYQVYVNVMIDFKIKIPFEPFK